MERGDLKRHEETSKDSRGAGATCDTSGDEDCSASKRAKGESEEEFKDMNVPFLGAIPMDPKLAEAGDSGRALLDQDAASPMARAMNEIIIRIAGPAIGDISRGKEPGVENKLE